MKASQQPARAASSTASSSSSTPALGSSGKPQAEPRPKRRPRPSPQPFAPVDPEHDFNAPPPWLMAMEARAPLELASMLALLPWLSHLPRGDGHPVIVYPGLVASDLSTVPLRRVLQALGYQVYAWGQGLNFGPRGGVLQACREQLQQVHQRHGQTVSLLGWSLGGLYARELAKDEAPLARCVITLGTPFTGHPRATNAWRLYELVSGQSSQDPLLRARLAQPPACPTTSIYSRTDGVVAWQCSLNPDLPHTENIEVPASHIGMGMNPAAMYALADRLCQRPGQWRKFESQGLKRFIFKTPQAGA